MLTTTRPTTFRRTTAYLTRLVSRELSAAAAYLRLLPRSIPPARRVRVRPVFVYVLVLLVVLVGRYLIDPVSDLRTAPSLSHASD